MALHSERGHKKKVIEVASAGVGDGNDADRG